MANTYHTAYISVGSNMGDKEDNCRRGVVALIQDARCRLIKQSNYAVNIETERGPFSLMDLVVSIERRVGRVRNGIRFGPRVLDLDIIFYDDLIIDTPQLKIPHPRMHERHFVLKSMCDISPEMRHPVLKRTMRRLLDELDKTGQGILTYK